MKRRRVMALLLSSAVAASVLAGCGSINKDAVVATFDGQEVKLGLANFIVKVEQAGYDDTYLTYFGDNAWDTDLYGDGTTMEQTLKDSIMDTLQEIYTLESYMEEYDVSLTDEETAAITATAEQFLADNDEKTLEALGADAEIVEEYLRLTTIRSKMEDVVTESMEVEVTDEEANTSAYSYVEIEQDSDADDAETVAADLEALAETVEEFAQAVEQSSLEDAAEEYGYTVETGTFTADDEDLDAAVLEALLALGEGETSGLIDGDTSYFVVRLDAETDEEATEANRQSITEERKEEQYEETLEGWLEEHEWVVNEKVWKKVTISNRFTTETESEETEEDAETEETEDVTEE